jgi:glycerol-3-phosphate acyltransferase PlsY
MGGLLGVMPGCLILGLVTWAIVFFSTRYVALASIGFGISLPVCAMVNAWSIEESSGAMGKVFLAFVIMGWIVWRHRSNIIRLREGTENRFQKKSKN